YESNDCGSSSSNSKVWQRKSTQGIAKSGLVTSWNYFSSSRPMTEWRALFLFSLIGLGNIRRNSARNPEAFHHRLDHPGEQEFHTFARSSSQRIACKSKGRRRAPLARALP